MSEPLDDWVTVAASVAANSGLGPDQVQFSEGALGPVPLPEDGTELVLGVIGDQEDTTWEVKVQAGSTALLPAMEVSTGLLAELQQRDAGASNTCRVRRYARQDRTAKLWRPEFAVAALAVVTGVLALLTVLATPANPARPVQKLARELEALAPRPPGLLPPPRPVAGRPPAVRADDAHATWSQARQLHQQLTAYRDGVQQASVKALAAAPSGATAAVLKWATAAVGLVSAGFGFLVAWRTHTAHGQR